MLEKKENEIEIEIVTKLVVRVKSLKDEFGWFWLSFVSLANATAWPIIAPAIATIRRQMIILNNFVEVNDLVTETSVWPAFLENEQNFSL